MCQLRASAGIICARFRTCVARVERPLRRAQKSRSERPGCNHFDGANSAISIATLGVAQSGHRHPKLPVAKFSVLNARPWKLRLPQSLASDPMASHAHLRGIRWMSPHPLLGLLASVVWLPTGQDTASLDDRYALLDHI